MKIKIDSLDILFSKYIRTRDGWTCRRCHRYCGPETGLRLDCSHIFSRRHKVIRHDPRNALSHCFTCHQWFGGNPIEAAMWARSELGDKVIDELLLLKNSRTKLYAADRKMICLDLKNKLATLEAA